MAKQNPTRVYLFQMRQLLEKEGWYCLDYLQILMQLAEEIAAKTITPKNVYEMLNAVRYWSNYPNHLRQMADNTLNQAAANYSYFKTCEACVKDDCDKYEHYLHQALAFILVAMFQISRADDFGNLIMQEHL